MDSIAAQTGREVGLMCDPSQLVPSSDRWIAHVGALVFGKGATPEEALSDLLRQTHVLRQLTNARRPAELARLAQVWEASHDGVQPSRLA